jgi:hypothetical protein
MPSDVGSASYLDRPTKSRTLVRSQFARIASVLWISSWRRLGMLLDPPHNERCILTSANVEEV